MVMEFIKFLSRLNPVSVFHFGGKGYDRYNRIVSIPPKSGLSFSHFIIENEINIEEMCFYPA